jgi:hypothetical protein
MAEGLHAEPALTVSPVLVHASVPFQADAVTKSIGCFPAAHTLIF